MLVNKLYLFWFFFCYCCKSETLMFNAELKKKISLCVMQSKREREIERVRDRSTTKGRETLNIVINL